MADHVMEGPAQLRVQAKGLAFCAACGSNDFTTDTLDVCITQGRTCS
jgi:hypothetical protein